MTLLLAWWIMILCVLVMHRELCKIRREADELEKGRQEAMALLKDWSDKLRQREAHLNQQEAKLRRLTPTLVSYGGGELLDDREAN